MNYIPDVPRTALDVFKLLPEGTRCEVMGNAIYMLPSPTARHQQLIVNVLSQVYNHNEYQHIGELFIGPFDVYLDNGASIVQPDMMFILKENSDMVLENGIHGTPDLIIEVLLADDADTRRKFKLYQRNQVPEYIIIDPITTEVWHYLLTDGLLVRQPTVNGFVDLKAVNIRIDF